MAVPVVGTDGNIRWQNLPSSIIDGEQGLVSQNYDRALARDSFGPPSGALRVGGLPLLAGQTVTKLHFLVQTAGVSMVNAWAALFDPNFNLVASSADSPGSFGGTGLVSLAAIVPYVVPTPGYYYAGILQIATTPAALAGVSPSQANTNVAIGKGQIRGGAQVGLGGLPNPAAITAPGFNFMPWMGLT